MRFVVGLGNPGSEYAATYHNVGFRVVGAMAEARGIGIRNRVGPALISSETTVGGETARFVLPQTFMNRSGEALTALFERFGAGPGDLIVVYDEIALPLGKIRIRQKGSAGGHNGIKSAISACGSDEFYRVRVGIGPERRKQPEQPEQSIGDMKAFVLAPIGRDKRALLESAEDLAARAVEKLIENGYEKAMAEFNGVDLRPAKEPEKPEGTK